MGGSAVAIGRAGGSAAAIGRAGDPASRGGQGPLVGHHGEVQDLDEVIEGLGRVQGAVIKADLAHGGQADNARLAAQLGTSANSIYVSRNKAHEAIRKGMRQRGHYADRPGGKR